jgi:hypothetical protein
MSDGSSDSTNRPGVHIDTQQLQEQELQLRTTIDTAIAAVRKGDIAMDMATRQVSGLWSYNCSVDSKAL